MGPYADRLVAERLRTELSGVGEQPPSLRTVMGWRPRQRAHVERWAARQALIRAGDSTLLPLPRPAVLDRAPRALRADYRATADRRARDRGEYADPEHLRIVRTMECCAGEFDAGECDGRIDPHHAGEGLSCPDPERRKTCDRTAIPMCRYHHRAVETLGGWFRTWNKGRRRQQYDVWIARTRAAVAERRTA